VFTYRDPAFDLDRDGHSDYQSLRGSNWKGKDCNDYDSNIRPGRRTNNQDLLFDTNCNGIYVIMACLTLYLGKYCNYFKITKGKRCHEQHQL